MRIILLKIAVILMVIANVAAAEPPVNEATNAIVQPANQFASCQPGLICYQRASNSQQLLQSLLRCDKLGDTIIVYQPPSEPNIEVNLAHDAMNHACLVVVKNTATSPISSQTCSFTKEEIATMASSQAQNLLQDYDQTGRPLNDAQMSVVFGAFYRCMKGTVNPAILANQVS